MIRNAFKDNFSSVTGFEVMNLLKDKQFGSLTGFVAAMNILRTNNLVV